VKQDECSSPKLRITLSPIQQPLIIESRKLHPVSMPMLHGSIFQNSFLANPFLVSKNNHGSSHPCSRFWMMGNQKQKNYISEIILDRYEYAPAALHVTKLTVARFVGTRWGGVLIRYSNGCTI
jgi:hypothetical protein